MTWRILVYLLVDSSQLTVDSSSTAGFIVSWQFASEDNLRSLSTVNGLSTVYYLLTLPACLDRGPRFAIDLPALDRLALVVLFLAFGQTDRHLHAAVLEVHPHGHERHA